MEQDVVSLHLLWITPCILYYSFHFLPRENLVDLHCSGDHPRVGGRVRVGPVVVESVGRHPVKTRKRMVESSVLGYPILSSLIVVIVVLGVFDLRPDKVLGEQFLDSCGRIQPVKLLCIWDLSEMPAGPVSKQSALSLRTSSAGFNLRSAGLGICSYGGLVCKKPFAYRGSFPVRISHHGRVEFSVLLDKHFVADSCGLRLVIRRGFLEQDVRVLPVECSDVVGCGFDLGGGEGQVLGLLHILVYGNSPVVPFGYEVVPDHASLPFGHRFVVYRVSDV